MQQRAQSVDRAYDEIVEDARIMAGEPVCKGTRVPVWSVAGSLDADIPVDQILEAYPSLTNALMAWNTQHMQRAVERIEAIGGEKLRPEDLRRIAPTNLEGINLRGTFEFPLERYAGRIMPSTTGSEILVPTKRVA
jgi:uncharacterized protein (DUF433 family)